MDAIVFNCERLLVALLMLLGLPDVEFSDEMLHSLDRLHDNIEEIVAACSIYHEVETGMFQKIGKPSNRFQNQKKISITKLQNRL